jgi:hypothetical protein
MKKVSLKCQQQVRGGWMPVSEQSHTVEADVIATPQEEVIILDGTWSYFFKEMRARFQR